MILPSKNCLICNKVFTKGKYCSNKSWEKSKFCSKQCTDSWRKSKEFSSLISKNKTGKGNFRTGIKLSKETREKMSLSATGKQKTKEARKNMSMAKKGIKKEQNIQWTESEYTLDWTETLRRSIRERDNYVCRLCLKPQGDIAHCVHHIDYMKQNNDPKNLITLCNECHGKTNFSRDWWINFFTKKFDIA